MLMTNCKLHRIRQRSDESSSKGSRGNFSEFDNFRKWNSPFILEAKPTSFWNWTNIECEFCLKLAFDSKFRGFPHYHIICIKSHSCQLNVEP